MASVGLGAGAVPVATALVLGLGVLVIAWLANLVAKRIILRLVAATVRRTATSWDDALLERNVFGRLSHLAPAVVIQLLVPLAVAGYPAVLEAILRLTVTYMVVAGSAGAVALANAAGDIAAKSPRFSRVPVKSYVQLLQIFLFIIAATLVIATLLDRSPWGLLSGLGALTAVLLLVFRDSILGLVATVQLSGQDLVRVGDWIEMPSHDADGDVIEMTLHTVKVQNWDKTVTSIPTHALAAHPFRNWRGMQESGGRRIKRSLRIDMNTVRFVDEETVSRYRRFEHLGDYIDTKLAEIDAFNRENVTDPNEVVNGRRLTNLGTFRAYIAAYLHHHAQISDTMTFLVRQLEPTDRGIPIEIYVFTTDTRWAVYEGIQADIFDHLLAVLPEFGLRIYQNPSGADLAALGASGSDQAGRRT